MSNQQKMPSMLRRLAVMTYDFLLLIALLFLATAILLPFHQGQSFQPNTFLYSAYLVGISFIFYGWFWTHGGQTLGLSTWKLRLVSGDGGPVSWKQASIRFITAIFSWGFFGLGIVWILINNKRRSWHDLSSNTFIEWQAP